jgi:hypothetical protein
LAGLLEPRERKRKERGELLFFFLATWFRHIT